MLSSVSVENNVGKQKKSSLKLHHSMDKTCQSPSLNTVTFCALEHTWLTFQLYKVKTQYVQTSNIVDISIKHPISGESTPILKGCMYMFDMVDIPFSY